MVRKEGGEEGGEGGGRGVHCSPSPPPTHAEWTATMTGCGHLSTEVRAS